MLPQMYRVNENSVHGSTTTYRKGCRCASCKEAVRQAHIKYRDSLSEQDRERIRKNHRDWKREHPEQVRSNDRLWKKKHPGYRHKQVVDAKKFVANYLKEHPCIDCGESDLVVLEFDHVTGIKLHGISQLMGRGQPIEMIKLEIEKCQVRCANCHRRRHNKNRLATMSPEPGD